MPSFQTQTAHSLYLVGASLLLFGLCWGYLVGVTPFPKLALTAHIQFMAEGSMVLLAGFLTEKTELIKLSKGQCWMVWAGMLAVWPTLLSECANAWWGTKDLLPIAAERAGAMGAPLWQEMVVTLAHAVGGLGLVSAWGVLCCALWNRNVQGVGKEK